MRIGRTSAVHVFSRLIVTGAGFLGTWYFAQVVNPVVLGTYFLSLAVLSWMSTVGNLGVQRAVTKRLSEGAEKHAFLSAGVLVQTLILFGIIFMLIVFWRLVSDYLGMNNLIIFVTLIIASISLDFVRAVLRGEQKVHISSGLVSVDRVGRVIIQVVLLVVGYELIGLFVGYTLAAAGTIVIGLVYVSSELVRPEVRHIQSLLDFSKYSWLGSIRSRAYHGMDTVVLGFFIGQAFIAVYEIAWNISTVFIIFGDAIGEAFFPEISSIEENPDRVVRYLNDALAFAGLLTIPGVVGSLVIGKGVLQIYGTYFTQGYFVLIVLTFAGLFKTYETQFLMTLNGLDRPDLAYRAYGAFLLSNLLLNVLLVWKIGLIGAAYGTAIATLISMVVAFRQVQKVIQLDFPRVEIRRQVLAAVVMGVLVLVGRQMLATEFITTIILVIGGAVIYFTVLLSISPRLRETVQTNISKS